MIDLVTIPPTRDVGPTVVRLGIDIGQRQDFSAICVTEQESRLDLPHYRVRFIQRLPLGTPYPAVVDRIEDVVRKLEAKGQPRLGPRKYTVELLLDATGVGLAVGDICLERGLNPKLILFTGSDKINEQSGVTMVGKSWMISRLQVLLQSQRLHLPRTIEAGQLVKELMDYEISVNQHANASFNAKSGSHDDLVISLGLSCGIERSVGKATSRRYTEPNVETLEDSLRDRYARRLGGR